MTSGRFVSYIRVSTAKQGASGLGLEAQREAVAQYIAAGNGTLCVEFVEVETGKGSNALAKRPALREAIETARKMKATLLIAKLDRLARNVHFISGLLESGVDFKAVDNPHANKMMVQLLAVFAENEREMISVRTKAALQAAKARGVLLGANGAVLAKVQRDAALAHVAPIAGRLQIMRQSMTERQIADALNAEGFAGPRNGPWIQSTVHRALKRLDAHTEAA